MLMQHASAEAKARGSSATLSSANAAIDVEAATEGGAGFPGRPASEFDQDSAGLRGRHLNGLKNAALLLFSCPLHKWPRYGGANDWTRPPAAREENLSTFVTLYAESAPT
jgi:hypothetical protein